jgi:hypothetical protein
MELLMVQIGGVAALVLGHFSVIVWNRVARWK